MRRSIGPWLTLPVLLLLAGSMSVASGYLARDVAGRNTSLFSTVTPERKRSVPPTVGIMDLSDDQKELVDDGSLELNDSPDSLRPTTIIGGWALPWGFYHGDPNVGDHFPIGAGPKAPWIHKEWRGGPWADASAGATASHDDHTLASPGLKAPIVSQGVELPTRNPGSIHVDHFTISAVVPTPEPTVGLSVLALGWLALRRK